jgi:hypothetical protein
MLFSPFIIKQVIDTRNIVCNTDGFYVNSTNVSCRLSVAQSLS